MAADKLHVHVEQLSQNTQEQEKKVIAELQEQAESLMDTSFGQQASLPEPNKTTVSPTKSAENADMAALAVNAIAHATTTGIDDSPVHATDNKKIVKHSKIKGIATDQQDFPEIYVNDVPITKDSIGKELQYHQASSQREAIFLSAQALVIRELLKQNYMSIHAFDDQALTTWQTNEEQATADLLSKHISVDTPSDTECQLYYENNRNKFVTSPLMQVRHILMPAHPEDGDERLEVRAKANELIAELANKPAQCFADMARQYSACPSKDNGGSLGQLNAGDTVPEFEKVVFKLEKGLHGAPVESRYGWHIVHVDDVVSGKPLDYDMVKPQIMQTLSNHDFNQKLIDYLFTLANHANIEGITLNLEQENVYRG